MTERDRIEKVMQFEQMNSAVFAAAIGIQGSTLSHILNGRNNPSLTVLQSILNRFPNISPEWLIMGQGSMERGIKHSQEPTLFDSVDVNVTNSAISLPKKDEKADTPIVPIQQKTIPIVEPTPTQPVDLSGRAFIPPITDSPARSVRKVIVYYTDNTFQEFQ